MDPAHQLNAKTLIAIGDKGGTVRTMTFMLAMLLSREIDHAGDYDNDLAEMYARSACMQGVGDRLKVILLCPELHDTDKVILLCTGFSCI